MKIERKNKHSGISQSHGVDTSRRETLQRLAGGTAAALMLAACGGGGGDVGSATGPGTTPGEGTNPGATPAGNRQVVVVGNEADSSSISAAFVGKMWLNGTEKLLPVDPFYKQSFATGVAFSAQEPVVAGYHITQQTNGGLVSIDDQAKLWYNGEIQQPLTAELKGDYQTTGIFILGNDVYVSGIHKQGEIWSALYWKNSAPVFLTKTPDKRVGGPERTTALVTRDNDVFVAGFVQPAAVTPTAVYWKNGVQFDLTDPAKNTYGAATSIALNGQDVYIGGYVFVPGRLNAVVWKNGAPQILADLAANGETLSSKANAIAVSGNDVYVAGEAEELRANVNNNVVARLWKNGIKQELEGADSFSSANAVVVIGSDVYVAGHAEGTSVGRRAVLWVNGKLQRLSDGKKFASAIALAVK